MSFGTFEGKTPQDQSRRRAVPALPLTMLDPVNAEALEQGEWLVPEEVDGVLSYIRWADAVATAATGPVLAFPVGGEKGRSDQQALGKVEIHETWEVAETGCYKNDDDFSVPGTLLKVATVDVDGTDYCILALAVSGDHVVAAVMDPPADPDTYSPMRIRRYSGIAP